jgi:hypothetical protein
VRVFVIPGGRHPNNPGLSGGTENANGLYIPYMENVVDFLRRAQKYGVYVLPTFGDGEMISSEYFKKLSGDSTNQAVLFNQKGLNAKAKFIQLFLMYIKERDESLLNVLAALQMQNEFAFYNTRAPFTQTEGAYTFINGQKYDMSDNYERRALANDAIKLYYKTMKEAVVEIVPDMLICEGTFTNLAAHKYITDPNVLGIHPSFTLHGDPRFPMAVDEYLDTEIDFLDLHLYTYGQETPKQIFDVHFGERSMRLNSEKSKTLRKAKPLIMGEYGSFASSHKDIGAAGKATLEEGMKASKILQELAYENGFSGDLIWTLDCFEQTMLYQLFDENCKYITMFSKKYN